MKNQIVFMILACSMMIKIWAGLIDESQGFDGFLSNMGYRQEVVPMIDEVLKYEDYEHFKAFGKNILLIINYNYKHYENNNFLKELYEPFFSKIVFYGPENHDEVTGYNALNGILGYMPIALAMEKYPHYDGYLYVEDDCVVHLWNCVRFDKEKIWIGDRNARRAFGFDEKPHWVHWNSVWGVPRLYELFKKLPSKYRLMLERNVGHNRALGGLADIAYFPSKFRNEVIELCKLFAQENVFIEIAISTIAACLDKQENWESMHGRWCYLDKYNPFLDFVHPMKFSRADTRLVATRYFQQMARLIDCLKNESVEIP